MALAFLQSTTGTDANGPVTSTAFGSSTTSGNLIVVGLATYNGGPGTVTDSKSNAYAQISTTQTNSAINISLWYCNNIIGGASHTVTGSRASAFNVCNIIAMEFSGSFLAMNISGTGTTGSSAAPSAGSLSGAANGLVVAIQGNTFPENASLGAGFSNLVSKQDASNSINIGMESQPLISSGSVSGAFTTVNSHIWAAVMAVFQPSRSGLPENMGRYLTVGDGMSRSEVAN